MGRQEAINAWTSVIITALFFFYWFIQLSLSNTLIEFYIEKYTLISYGSFTAMYLVGNIIMFIPAGVITDRYKSKVIISLALITMLAGISLMIISDNIIVGYTSMLCIGFAGAFTMISCVKVSMKWFSNTGIAIPVSICISIAFLGGYFGNVVGRYVLKTFDTGVAVQISNLSIGVLILLLAFLFIKEPITKAHKNTTLKNELQSMKILFMNKQNWYIGWCTSFLNFPVMILEFSFGQQYLINNFSIKSSDSSMIAGLISIGFIFGTIFWGKLSDLCGTRKKTILLGIALSIMISLSLLKQNLSFYNLAIIFILIGIFTSSQTLGYTLAAESNSIENTGAVTAIVSIFIMGGGAVIQVIFDIIRISLSYKIAYLIIPTSMLLAFLLAIFIKDPSKNIDLNKK